MEKQAVAQKAAESLYRTVVRILGEDNKRIIASMVGESPQGLSDVLNGHRGSLDRVASWVWNWNRDQEPALVLELGAHGSVHVFPENLEDYFQLSDSDSGNKLRVRTAPDNCWRPTHVTVDVQAIGDVPRRTLVQAWESARVEKSSTIARVLRQAESIPWESLSDGRGTVRLSDSAGVKVEWLAAQFWVAPGRNVAAFRIRCPGAGSTPLEQTTSDFLLQLLNVSIETRDATIAPISDDECILVVRPAPKITELLDALEDRSGVTAFWLTP